MKCKICIPIVENNIESAKQAIFEASQKADIIELRVDFIEGIDAVSLGELIDFSSKPVIVTCRLKEQGGTGKITEKNRSKLFDISIGKNVEYIDLEYISNVKLSELQSTKIITSHHDFEQTPEKEEILALIKNMQNKDGNYIKYITTANSINDNFKIFEILQNNENLISFCMGLKGHISRILTAKFGSPITYSSNSNEKQSAPGQINIDDLLNLYNFQNINSATEVFGIIGKFAENSKSKYMHNPVFQEKRINAIFLPFKVEFDDDLKFFMSNFKKFNFSGSAVTIPHKVTVMNYLDEIHETAKAIGAVNTINLENGKLIGYNTDCIGAIRALQEKVDLQNKRVLVLGAGGAARAIVYGLKMENAEVCIANRTFEKAQKLADEFTVNSMEFEKISDNIEDFDVFINTTSVGMHPDVNSTILESFPKNRVVMDIVYKPLKTKFLQIAEKCDCEIITGEKMLVWQAIAQQKIWTGNEPDFKFMLDAFYKV